MVTKIGPKCRLGGKDPQRPTANTELKGAGEVGIGETAGRVVHTWIWALPEQSFGCSMVLLKNGNPSGKDMCAEQSIWVTG